MSFIALIFCIGFVLWLLARDAKRAGRGSRACWIPLIWILVGASRPVSSWFSQGAHGSPDGYDSGNPFERNIYLILIFLGICVHWSRGTNFRAFIYQNRSLALLTLFWGLSVLWADYSFISLKRWVKDTGTILMVLILLTEKDPKEAFLAAFVRCAYVLAPFSLLLIRYYGNLGRSYENWGGELMYIGVTSHKSSLGVLTLISTLALAWDFSKRLRAAPWRRQKIDLLGHGLVLAMSAYLLAISASATSQVCAALGLGVFAVTGLRVVQRNIKVIGLYAAAAALALITLNEFVDIKTAFLNFLGKDPTLTTRTEVWPILLGYQENPLVGEGFRGFWAGARLRELIEKYQIIQAHNGYLETYLNGGAIGVALLLAFVFAGWRAIKQELVRGTEFARVRLVCWVVAVVHNYTEASFNTFSPLWIALLAVSMPPLRSRFWQPKAVSAELPPRFKSAEPGIA